MWSQRVGHEWATFLSIPLTHLISMQLWGTAPCTLIASYQCFPAIELAPELGKFCWRRNRLPTPVFWPGEFHGLYSPWGCKESDTTEWPSLYKQYMEKWMATHFRVLAWEIPWTEEPGQLQSTGSQRVRHNCVTFTFMDFLFWLFYKNGIRQYI